MPLAIGANDTSQLNDFIFPNRKQHFTYVFLNFEEHRKVFYSHNDNDHDLRTIC